MKHQTVHGRTHKNGMSRRLALAVGAALLSGAFSVMPVACANPVLDAKDAAVTITGTSDMSITSTASNNVIKWVDFSIGSGEKVAFDTNNYLNFVTGSARSDILGTLTGGGNIYIVNPNGILIGDNATVNVGNLYLSTRNLSDDVLNNFSASTSATPPNPLTAGAIGGDVVNLGKLNATSVTVEGNNITFKNVADVTLKNDAPEGSKINVTAGGEIRVGFAVSETPADAVNDTQYKAENVAAPDLTGWSFNGGEKTPVQYMLVRNACELQNINNNLGGNYMLAGDVTLPTVAAGKSNFTPIGGYYSDNPTTATPFSGKFDGLNHQIKNLSIHITESSKIQVAETTLNRYVNHYVGLFRKVGTNGVVENLGLVGGSVTGSNYVGGIAGMNAEGTIRNVYHTGSVTGSSYVGGIVGNNAGTVERAYNTGTVTGSSDDVGGIVGVNHGTVERAYNTGAVTGTGEKVGGVAGYCDNTVKEVFNAGTVSAENRAQVGGVVGMIYGGSIENAYNTGAVTGKFDVGGIVGLLTNASTVTAVYNTGNITGKGTDGANRAYIGGLVGAKDGGTLTNAYSKSGVVSAPSGAENVSDTVGSHPEIGTKIDNAADLKKAATFTGFDFSESGAWRIYEKKTTPFLAAFPIPEPTSTPDPVNPDPVNPDPVNPDPVNPDPVNPNPTPAPTPEPAKEPASALENVIGSQGTAAEYTNTIASLNSETTNGLSAPVTTTPTGAAPESQNDNTQEGNAGAAVPQTQNAGGLSFATSERLTIQGGGVNMPESMGTEALAAALSGSAPAEGAPPSNATPTNEPTAQTPAAATEPTAEPTSARDDEEE